MDGFAHMAWGYLLWYDSPYTWLAVFMCVMPDLVGFIPEHIAQGVRDRSWKSLVHSNNPPAWAARYKKIMFPITHSLVISLGAFFVVSGIWGWQWWMLGWPLHVLIDIFTHAIERATPYMWPLRTKKVNGIAWTSKTFLRANYALLVLAFVVVFFVR